MEQPNVPAKSSPIAQADFVTLILLLFQFQIDRGSLVAVEDR
jgi:hypothetical protein